MAHPIQLLDLSDELLYLICAHAMTWTPSPSAMSAAATGQYWHHYPTGVVAEQLSQNYRLLLKPLRCCTRLYRLAKHVFLETNTVALSLRDMRNSAIRLEQQPRNSQILCTGNPDPLLAAIVHLQLAVSISDLRAPFSQPFAPTPQRDVVGVMWRSTINVRELQSESEALAELSTACPRLQSVHIVLKVDEWFLWHDGGLRGTDLLRREDGEQSRNDAGTRYRALAETVVALMADVRVRVGTVAFHHWRADVETLDLRSKSPGAVIDALIGDGQTTAILSGPMARVATAGQRSPAGATEVLAVKRSWGASDDVQHV